MDESDGDQLSRIILSCFDVAQQDINRKTGLWKGLGVSSLFILFLFQSTFASGLGGYTGTASRFTSDPLSAGTGGITLFSNSSTLSALQNPASRAFEEQRAFDAGMVQLSLDRFIYTVSASAPMPPTAHLSVGLVSAGTNNITARDSRGYPAGELYDTEMAYLLSFSNRFSDKLAFGLSFKLLTRTFTSEEDWLDEKGSGFGAGLGLVLKPRPGSTFALALKDWNSSYKWKTQDQSGLGRDYHDEFPMSLAWGWLQEMGSTSLAIEHDYYLIDEHIFRAAIIWDGVKNLNIHAGFSYEDEFLIPGVSARYELFKTRGTPMHIDLGFRSGVVGESLRSYLGWGVNF